MTNDTGAKSTFLLGGGTELNRLSYGAMQLTGTGVWGDVEDRANAISILREAVAAGVNFIDTADAYGPNTNELLIAEALQPYKDGLVIATKGGFERTGPGAWKTNGHPQHISDAIEGSLKRLGVKQIDLWQLHRVDPNVTLEDTLAPVAEAVKSGKIKYVGLSEVDIELIEQAEKVVPIASVQNMYNLGERKWDRVVDYTAGRNIAFIPWFPLASGPEKLAEKLKKIANQHGATTSQVALAWLLQRSPNILPIPGTKSIQHLKENLGANNIHLTEEEMKQLSNS